MALGKRGLDGQTVRIPQDGSRDVQASIQDIKDVLRNLSAKLKIMEADVASRDQAIRDRVSKIEPEAGTANFVTFSEDVIFLSRANFEDGSAANPSITFTGDPDVGLFRPTNDAIGIAAAGETALRISEQSGDKYVEVWDGDETNYESLSLQKDAGSDAYLLTRSGGTGSARNASFGAVGAAEARLYTNGANRWGVTTAGHLYPISGDSYDVGVTGTRIRNIYITNGNVIDGFEREVGGAILDTNGLAAITVYLGEFQQKGTIVAAYARRTGGTGATVNIQNGGSDIRSADLSLTTTAWTSFGTLQNTSVTAGNDFDLELASVAGTVTQIAMYVVFRTIV